MSHQTDMQYMTATDALKALAAINIDTTTAQESITRWTRVRNAASNARTPDTTELWAAVAADDQKAVTKAASTYMTARAILDAAKADPRREDTFRADTMSIVKQLVKAALPEARDLYNEHGAEYEAAFHAAGGEPNPAQLIVSEGGSEIWASLVNAAQGMDKAVTVIKLSRQFGLGVNDQGTGLGEVVPYVQGIDDITAVTRAKSTEWLQGKEHSAHRDYATFLIAGGTLRAGDLHEQEQEIERLTGMAEDSRKTTTIPDMIAKDERRALARAMKAQKK